MNDLAKLNRLRVNAGKPELKSWKASQAKLADSIKMLEDQGFTDVVAGANIDAKPVTNDPEVAAARPEPEIPSLSESHLSKNIDNGKPDKPAPKVTNGRPHLARGIDGDQMARQSRARIQEIRAQEKAKLSKKDKQQIKDEAESRKLPKGQVDPKKDPEKAARQQKHIEEKQAKRAAEGREAKPRAINDNEVTVAMIARELDIDPKVARAKLRRHEDKLTKLHTKGQDRWTFPKSAAPELKKILRGGK